MTDMYTRCPSCSCTFRVTAAALQMAEGDVRCGSCGAVFNALRTLVDDWETGSARLPSVDAAEVADEPRDASGEDRTDGDTLEFDAPERDWQRFFIEPEETPVATGERAEPELGADFPGREAPDDGDVVPDHDAGPVSRSLEEETADTDTWKAFLRDSEDGPDDGEAPQPAFVIGEPDAEPDEAPQAAAEPVVVDGAAEDDTAMAGPPLAAPAAAAATPDTVLDWGPPPSFPETTPAPPAHHAAWLAASLAAAAVLAGQILHHYRDEVAADPSWGEWMRAAYARLDQPLFPAWPIDAYEIRGAKAIAENSTPGALDIIAEIAVTGTQPVGLPMVRVVLRDRWTNAVASGVFEPADYLAEAPAPLRTYAPGTLLPVAISLKDPGSAAQGYEIDVCLPNRRFGLQCKSARDPFRR